MVRQLPFKQYNAGSIPAGLTNARSLTERHLSSKQNHVGSSPTGRANACSLNGEDISLRTRRLGVRGLSGVPKRKDMETFLRVLILLTLFAACVFLARDIGKAMAGDDWIVRWMNKRRREQWKKQE